ncbi:transmembrane amino acid transporter protein-domain-containing protein [Aspergillus keveii]|uniref:Transmembrane amino acid transporter protein-domain-containing protein n=1 Tax=Aspergillus keveii TaxID=714993 RepID=A0ABR4GMV1_9EURO
MSAHSNPPASGVEAAPETKLPEREENNVESNKASIMPYPQDVFGDEEHAEVRYKVLTWWQCAILMVAETISLGVLALPAAIGNLGLVPALCILLGLGAVATYTGYVVGQLKWKYPHISSAADAGQLIMGRFGRELLFWSNMMYLVFIMASHLLTFTVAMNTITKHATCSIVFGVVGLIVSFLLAIPRTLERMTWLSFISFTSIIAAVLITMIAVGIQNTPPPITATNETNLVSGFTAAANIVFSFSSHNTFFTIISELREPRDFPKSLALLQSVDMTIYVVAAVVIYCYTGRDVPSPALGAAGPLISRISYGIALPTTACMHKRDVVAVGSWLAIAFGVWVVAWIIASSIPVFNSLLSLIVSLFASWFSFGLPGIFWLWMNKGQWFSSPRKIGLTFLNVFCICIGIILCGLGLYTSGKAIHDDPQSASFSCANNADY